MAQAPSTTQSPPREQTPPKEGGDQARSQLIVVDLDKRQSRKQVRRLRKGRGKLVRRIDNIVAELVEAGTIKAGAQPVVVVVREETPLPWPFGSVADDDDDDDD